jgi:hypothetical protein
MACLNKSRQVAVLKEEQPEGIGCGICLSAKCPSG